MQRLAARARAAEAWGLEYEDETWFVTVSAPGIMNPEAGSGWAAAGAPPRNPATRKKGRETFTAYLSVDAKEQRLSWRYTAHTNRWESWAYLQERVTAHERLGHTVLVWVWDAATWHTAHELLGWIRAHNRQVQQQGAGVKIVPVCQPVHAFWLNPVDAIIRHTKGRVLPCRQFASQTAQRAALDRYWLQRNLRRARAPKPEDLFAVLH